jgi:hypothetical protein
MFSQDIFEAAHNQDRMTKYVDRWDTLKGRAQHEVVLDLLRQGGGEGFIFNALERGQLSWDWFEKENDLRGITLQGEKITFPPGDNFEGTDFSYSSIYYCQFAEGYFSTNFEAARLYNVTFQNCTFHFASFKDCTIEKCTFVGCDFVERCGFSNSNVQGTVFEDVYMSTSIFQSCKFDNDVALKGLRLQSRETGCNAHRMPESELANIYFDLAEGYSAGNSYLCSKHLFMANQFVTKYRTKSLPKRLLRTVFYEFLMGYGERPLRCLLFSFALIVVFGILYFLTGTSTATGNTIGLPVSIMQADSYPLAKLLADLGDSIFFSVVTFTTVGYGNIVPVGAAGKILSAIEMLSGATLTGCWVALLLRKALEQSFRGAR